MDFGDLESLAGVFASEPDGDKEAATMSLMEAEQQLVKRFWTEAFLDPNPQAIITEICTFEYIFHDLATQKVRGRNDLLCLIEGMYKNIHDLNVIVGDNLAVTMGDPLGADGNCIVTHLTFRARRPESSDAAHEWVELNGISISRFSGNQIDKTWLYWDALRAEQELEPPIEWRFWPPW